jgi:hypothetical protein
MSVRVMAHTMGNIESASGRSMVVPMCSGAS